MGRTDRSDRPKSSEQPTADDRNRGVGRRVGSRVRSLVVEAGWLGLVLTLWVVGLALLFLATGWPRWAFYVATVLGAIAIVLVGPRPDPP